MAYQDKPLRRRPGRRDLLRDDQDRAGVLSFRVTERVRTWGAAYSQILR